MYRFRRNVTVVAVETHIARDGFDGPTRQCTHLQRYSLDAAVDPYRLPGMRNIAVLRMGVGRVAVRAI